MELYFQEHGITTNSASTAQNTSQNRSRAALLQIAGMVSLMEQSHGAERERLSNEIGRLLSSLADLSVTGKPPASAEAIRALPVETPRPSADGQMPSCPICTEEFQYDDSVYKLPCHHYFHIDCVTPWLKKNCTCPVCRRELPTDDRQYQEEKRTRDRQAAASQMASMMFN